MNTCFTDKIFQILPKDLLLPAKSSQLRKACFDLYPIFQAVQQP